MRVVAAIALALAGCSDGQSAGPKRDGGAPTLVSLNPCTDALLVELADPEQVLALSHYSRDPASSSMDVSTAREFGFTGGTVEEVLALDPDVVVAGSFLPPATRSALERLGIRVETFGIASSVEESLDQIERMAAIAGAPERGIELTRRITLAVRTNGATTQESVSTVLWQPGGIVPGDATLVSELMAEAGFTSHSQARGMAQADYLPLENVLADPPDLLIVAGDSRAQHHSALATVSETPIAEFDPSLLYCGGPTIINAMERLGEIRDKAK